jgi:multidrug efflux pump subunit AcrB
MMKKLITFFANKHLFNNFLFLAILAGGVIFWNQTGKEDMPNMDMDFVRIGASYSGATAEEIDNYVTTPIEEAVEGIDGLKAIRSTSNYGNCSVFVELDGNSPNRPHVVDELKDAMNGLRLPEEVETPNVSEFKSA